MSTQKHRFFSPGTAWMTGGVLLGGGIGAAAGVAMGLIGMGIGVGIAIGAVVGFIGGAPTGESDDAAHTVPGAGPGAERPSAVDG